MGRNSWKKKNYWKKKNRMVDDWILKGNNHWGKNIIEALFLQISFRLGWHDTS